MVRTRTSTAGNDGFTLLELIIILVIVGLSAAVVMFSIGRLHEKTLFNQDARKVYQTLRKAREIAVLERMEVVVHVDRESSRFGVEREDGKGASFQSLQKGTEILGEDIVFYPKGNSSGGVITLRHGTAQSYTIEVSQVLGKPSISRL